MATVARENTGPGGGWWLMNKRETGWSSSTWGLPSVDDKPPAPFPSLASLLELWNVRLGAAGVDQHGVFVEVIPA